MAISVDVTPTIEGKLLPDYIRDQVEASAQKVGAIMIDADERRWVWLDDGWYQLVPGEPATRLIVLHRDSE